MMKDGRLPWAMDTGLYIAASGMLAQQVRQDQLANDLSNASTPGYKKDSSVQQSFGALLLANTATGQALNRATLEGMTAYLASRGAAVGLYATTRRPTATGWAWSSAARTRAER